ncbi:hypothetical protein ACMFMG_002800 [Clarireedia jacksonii]
MALGVKHSRMQIRLTRNPELVTQYPYLVSKIESHGLQNLEICVLGPHSVFFLRWLNGAYTYWADRAVVGPRIEQASQNNFKIFAIAFGYDNTYILSYGNQINTLGSSMDLKAHYPNLQWFLVQLQEQRRDINILAVTLDFRSTTDYIIIYSYRNDPRVGYIRGYLSDASIQKMVDKWWAEGTAAAAAWVDTRSSDALDYSDAR